MEVFISSFLEIYICTYLYSVHRPITSLAAHVFLSAISSTHVEHAPWIARFKAECPSNRDICSGPGLGGAHLQKKSAGFGCRSRIYDSVDGSFIRVLWNFANAHIRSVVVK